MDTAKDPGIAIEKILLIACEMVDLEGKGEKKYQLAITNLERTIISELRLGAKIEFNLMENVPDPQCKLRCVFGVLYCRNAESQMSWPDFKDAHIVAHILPYLREFVSNITSRMRFGTLILPPINSHLLVEQFKGRQSAPKALAPPAE